MSKITKDMVNNMSPEEFEAFMHSSIIPEKERRERKPGVYIHFPFDLRSSFDDKINYAAVGTVWTAYVNNAGTLAHVMAPEADILIRIKFYFAVNALSKERMKQVIMARVDKWLNFTE